MNPFDIIAVVILAFSLIRGVFRGLIKELSSLIAVLAGFYAAYTYYPQMARLLAKWISNIGYRDILSFLAIFCAVFLVISMLGVIIKYLMKITFLGWVDRIGGLAFGFVKGVLIVSVLLIALTAFLPKGAPIIKHSLLAPHVSMVSEKLSTVASGDMKHKFKLKIKDFKKTWKIP